MHKWVPVWRVGKTEGVGDKGIFFTFDPEYFVDNSINLPNHRKENALKYFIDMNAKIWNPVKELNLTALSWDRIEGLVNDFEKYGIRDECDFEMPEEYGITSTDGLSCAGKKLGFQAVLLSDIPCGNYWNFKQESYDEICVFDLSIIKKAPVLECVEQHHTFVELFKQYGGFLCESKDRLIDRLNLDDEQKSDMKAFFKKRPNLENKLDWNKLKDITWKDYLSVKNSVREPIDPDTVPEFSDKREEGNGIVSYEVQDDFDGLKAVRKIVDTHWGEDAKPWCLVDKNTEMATYYWSYYSGLPKRIAFKNGKLLAFMATVKFDSVFSSASQYHLAENLVKSVDPTLEKKFEDYFDTWSPSSFLEWCMEEKMFDVEGIILQDNPPEIWWNRKDYPFLYLKDLIKQEK